MLCNKLIVKSKSDVITNSSSEVYARITTDRGLEKLREIYKALDSVIEPTCAGDGGVFLDEEENCVKVEFGYEVDACGCMSLIELGFDEFMKKFEGECKIEKE